MSLSTWIRDYIYIPLGGRQGSKPRRMLNLAVAFLLSGLWHGANWRFALWGLLHALFVAVERAVKCLEPDSPASGRRVLHGPVRSLMRRVVTYHCVLIGWILFRSKDFDQAIFILRRIFSRSNLSVTLFPGSFERKAQAIRVVHKLFGSDESWTCLDWWPYRARQRVRGVLLHLNQFPILTIH